MPVAGGGAGRGNRDTRGAGQNNLKGFTWELQRLMIGCSHVTLNIRGKEGFGYVAYERPNEKHRH